MKKIITCEAVFKGHPDKICDQISDAILDACLKQDKHSRVGIECAIKDDQVWIFGEITTNAVVDYKAIASETLKEIGYKNYFEIRTQISQQSQDIALGVDKEGAGDQGMMFGYACNETDRFIPYPFSFANRIALSIDNLIKHFNYAFGPDGKCQVSAIYEDGKFKGIDTIVVSVRCDKSYQKDLERLISSNVSHLLKGISYNELLINPTGAFEIGGPWGDSGLTGRKIICDTYGGIAHHGGGAFSGKDPTKVDRSAAYYSRYAAKALVVAGLCDKCEVAVAYAIGKAEPVSLTVDTFGTAKIREEVISYLLKECFDFKPASIIKELNLRNTRYKQFASYGHFGRSENEAPWENVNEKAKQLQETLKARKVL